jgi:hypothetical protein
MAPKIVRRSILSPFQLEANMPLRRDARIMGTEADGILTLVVDKARRQTKQEGFIQ